MHSIWCTSRTNHSRQYSFQFKSHSKFWAMWWFQLKFCSMACKQYPGKNSWILIYHTIIKLYFLRDFVYPNFSLPSDFYLKKRLIFYFNHPMFVSILSQLRDIGYYNWLKVNHPPNSLKVENIWRRTRGVKVKDWFNLRSFIHLSINSHIVVLNSNWLFIIIGYIFLTGKS